jgi:hypothetical protein
VVVLVVWPSALRWVRRVGHSYMRCPGADL